MYSLDTFAREYLSRPRVARCVLCGCEIMDHHKIGPSGRTHHGCEFAELLDLDMIDGPEWDTHPSTGFGASAGLDDYARDMPTSAAWTDTQIEEYERELELDPQADEVAF